MPRARRLVPFAVVCLAATYPADRPAIVWNDNTEPAGRLSGGVLTLDLEVVRGLWRPVGEAEPPVEVLALREVGRPPSIPAPLIRVPLGTEVVATVRNPLDVGVTIEGLSGRRQDDLREVMVAAGAEREVRFVADAVGSYLYRLEAEGESAEATEPFEDMLLAGALIVDDPSLAVVPAEKVMVIQIWFGDALEDGSEDFGQEFMLINGRPWPHTERLRYEMGDSIHWRVLNASEAVHPMHLHGFFFTVESRGDFRQDTVYWPGQRRHAVTERMEPWTTMKVSWSPDRPGGWIFHCHNSFHVMANPGTAGDLPDEDTRVMELVRGAGHAGDPDEHAIHGMGGLVMALDIRAPDGWRIDEPGAERTRLYIHTDSTPGHAARRFGFVTQDGADAPAPDSVPFPGPPLILRQGPPASIRLINRTSEPTQIHWHGLELESYFDGVAGATGYEGRRTPAILPGDSFDVALRTDRPGTYIYHTHMTDLRQQASGLYGPLVVLPRDAEWDPEHDRIFIAGWGIGQQPELTGRPYLNGTRDGETLRMRAGETYRLRLINITMGNGSLRFRLVRDGEPVRWTPIAQDAYDLPDRQRAELRAEQTVSVGETYDFEYTPAEDGELRMEIRAAGGDLFAFQRIPIAPPPAPPAEEQIAAAVKAAPEDRRAGATVLGYDPGGALVTLREGTNDMICLADDPASGAWSVACYHASLDAFMRRGRDLRAEGNSGADVNAIRWKEVEDGALALPQGAILYVLHGSGWDEETGAVVDPYLRWVIYTPFATAEGTGLPLAQRAPGEPWLMSPGTAGAHIMITPARDGG